MSPEGLQERQKSGQMDRTPSGQRSSRVKKNGKVSLQVDNHRTALWISFFWYWHWKRMRIRSEIKGHPPLIRIYFLSSFYFTSSYFFLCSLLCITPLFWPVIVKNLHMFFNSVIQSSKTALCERVHWHNRDELMKLVRMDWAKIKQRKILFRYFLLSSFIGF